MVSRQVIRPSQVDDVQPHEHDAQDVSGVFGFLRALKAKIDGSMTVSGTLQIDNGSDLIVGNSQSNNSQLHIHNIQSHVALYETDDVNYPDLIFIWDVNGGNARGVWRDQTGTPVSTDVFHIPQTGEFEVKQRLLIPDGSATAPSLAFESAETVGIARDGGAMLMVVGDVERGRFSDVNGGLLLPAGSASFPTLSTTADTDTGLFFGSGFAAAAVGGAEVARFTADGLISGPLGYIGKTEKASGQTIGTTEADVTDLAVTFTALANRTYKATAMIRMQKDATANIVSAWITDGSNNKFQGMAVSLASGAHDNATLVAVEQPAAGSFTFKVRMVSSGGDVTAAGSATAPSIIVVEDIGPA